jgi:hypothetical protein
MGASLFVASCSSGDDAASGDPSGTPDGGAPDTGARDAGGSAPDADAAPSADRVSGPFDFWGDRSAIPAATKVMTFTFLNRTNGKFKDSEVYWSFTNASVTETHSIAERPSYDMPANASGRMYFYICAAGDATCAKDPTKSKYFDFIEHTIEPARYNGNTTRVDAFGLKLAMRLVCADGYDVAVGEDYETFLEDRAVTFQKFVDDVPAEFKALAQPPFAPYRIVEPGAGGFGNGGAHAHYYDAFVDAIWSANKITIPKPGPNGDGLAKYRDLSAAIFRHVGDKAGTFAADGSLLNNALWDNEATFYAASPAHYYARFWHKHALNKKAYGFPYDDVGSYSSYVAHDNPKYLIVAIGW